jgi:hypothetical protein
MTDAEDRRPTVRYRITLEVTVDADDFRGLPPPRWDWDEMLEIGHAIDILQYEILSPGESRV